ncbi:MAG: hypothetical protein ACTSV2_12495, partial [Candidatus Thorarchaeota archaeon]
KGRNQEALDYYNKFLEKDPNSFIAWELVAKCLDTMGKKVEATVAYEKMKELKKKLAVETGQLIG